MSDTDPTTTLDDTRGLTDVTSADSSPAVAAGRKRAGARKAAGRTRKAAAPKADTNPEGESKNKGGRPSTNKKRAEAVAGLYISAGMGLTLAGPMVGAPSLAADGMALSAAAQRCGQAWADLADKNVAVAKFLDNMTEGSAWGSVIMAHLPIAAAIIKNHVGGGPDPLPEGEAPGFDPLDLLAGLAQAG